MSAYAKMLASLIVAAVGAGLTAAIALISPNTTTWVVLTCVIAAITAVGAAITTYAVPNTPAPPVAPPVVAPVVVEEPVPPVA